MSKKQEKQQDEEEIKKNIRILLRNGINFSNMSNQKIEQLTEDDINWLIRARQEAEQVWAYKQDIVIKIAYAVVIGLILGLLLIGHH